ncbi:MAG: 6-bladed beta-propeller [Gemmatimonadota bacterium]
MIKSIFRSVAVFSALVLMPACRKQVPGTAVATVDTLPGGIVRTMSASPTAWADSLTGWRLVLDHTIQPGEGEPGELLNPGSVAMSREGDVFVRDETPSVVKVFDTSGRYLRAIGHEGDGPGEFRGGFIAVRGDTLVIQDPRNARVTTFRASDGNMITSWRSTCCYWYPVSLDGEGRVVLYAMAQTDSGAVPAQALIRAHLDGSGLDTAWATQRPVPDSKRWIVKQGKNNLFMMQVPFQPQEIHSADPAGNLLTGWNGEYLIRTSRNGRDTVSLFGRQWTAEPVTGAERTAIVEKRIADQGGSTPEAVLRAAFNPDYIPNVRPAYNGINADLLGNRWIRLETADTVRVHYDVFDPAGRWLGAVSAAAAKWSGSYPPPAWGSDRVAVLIEDEEGKPAVLIYRIEKRGASR